MFPQPVRPFACVRMRDTRQWQAIVHLCSGITPLMEEHIGQNMLMLALEGSERLLLKGEQALQVLTDPSEAHSALTWPLLGTALLTLFTQAGLAVDGFAVGIGPTRTLAWLASQQHTTRAVLPDDVTAFLSDLPVSVLLNLPDAAAIAACAEMVAALDMAGIRTLGQMRRVAGDSLARRFGVDGAALAMLASGGDVRPFRPRVAESWLGARLVFDPPLLAHQVMVALGPLAEHLALTLAERELAAGKLALLLESETGKRLQAERRLAHPLGTTRALLDVAERLLMGLLTDAHATVGETPGIMPDAVPDVALPENEERYSTLRLRVGGLHLATAAQQQLWARGQQQAGAERIERLRAALRALKSGKHADALLRAELHEPDAVLPEERYRLRPQSP